MLLPPTEPGKRAMTPKTNPHWPVLTRYDQGHLARIALPLGGIGTGTVSLGGRGDLRDWELVNRPAKGFVPRNAFFALWAAPAPGPSSLLTRHAARGTSSSPLTHHASRGTSSSPLTHHAARGTPSSL
ncbi:MAG: hypothetical protein FJ291_30310, partial [Planctomycetes bacterium]|nr:hypothetical protein [Planctomycetota bacterium]